MIWSILAGTHESTWDIKEDGKGNKYKESHGMASGKAVLNRNNDLSRIEQARRSMFKEGISTSKIYMKPGRSSVWDLLDEFTTWLRSTIAYTWASSIREYQENVIVWVQSNAWFAEWKPHKVL